VTFSQLYPTKEFTEGRWKNVIVHFCSDITCGGEEDLLTSPEEIDLIAQRIPGAMREIIPESGHLPNVEVPGAFNDSLVRLLAEWEVA